MANPFKYISHQFKDEFDVRFIVERMDGSLTVLLSDQSGIVARRRISAEQLSDHEKLKLIVQSIRFGLAIDQGHGSRCLGKMAQTSMCFKGVGR